MPTHVIDLSPHTLQFRNIDPAQEGAASLLAALIRGPIQRAQLEQQRQREAETQGRELWQMHHADDQFAREGQWHDDATKAAADERTYQHGRNDQEDARRVMNDYLNNQFRQDSLKAKEASHGPHTGDAAPPHIIQGLTTELVAVPKTDLFGDPVKGPDGKPVMTYSRQPVKDAAKRLRAAGIDPDTLRYADPADLHLQDAADAYPVGEPAAPAAPAAAPAAAPLVPLQAAPAGPGMIDSWLGGAKPGVSSGELAAATAEDKAIKASRRRPAAAAAPADQRAGEAAVMQAIPDLSTHVQGFLQRARGQDAIQLRQAIATGNVDQVKQLLGVAAAQQPDAAAPLADPNASGRIGDYLTTSAY